VVVFFFCFFFFLFLDMFLFVKTSWLLASVTDVETLLVLLFCVAGKGLLTDRLESEGGRMMEGCLLVVELTLDERRSSFPGPLG
jgi:hypothetical protein